MIRRVLGILFVFVVGCSGDDITHPDDIVFPRDSVRFSMHVQPLLNISCNFSGCHGEGGQTQLTSYLGVRALNVIHQPGDTNCGLLNVVFGRNIHVPVNVNDNHRQGLKQWVLEGAQNN